MKDEIEVLNGGFLSTIQDMGRFGFQKFGVPQSGVMDSYAAKISNLVLGNKFDAAVMEITMMGPGLKFRAPARICISGADLSARLNNESILLNTPVMVREGDVLKFGQRKTGFRAYLAITGGFFTELIMKSRSWYDGITDTSRLVKGMKIPFKSKEPEKVNTHASVKFSENYFYRKEVEVWPGPEFSHLSKEKQSILFNSEYTVDENSNRMAIQLKEGFINELASIITVPVLPGTVQLTPSGKLIVLMKDCQTTGGYPRILQLSEQAMQLLSQKLPGEKIKFKKLI